MTPHNLHPDHDTNAEARLQRENDYLADRLAVMEQCMPTPEELAYLRNRKEADERAAWVIKLVRSNAPWLFVLASALGSAVYWVLTHTITIGNKP